MSRLLLIIDDDPVEREILERGLLRAGYRVATAPDGQAGLEAVRSARPDLVLRFRASEVGADAFLTQPADVSLRLRTIADLTGSG